MLWLLLALGCGGCSDPPPPEPVLSAQERESAAKVAMLRVRLHARFMELTPAGVRVRVDNPTDLAVARAHIVVEGRTSDGAWQRDAWTGALAPGERDVELVVAVPDGLTGGIRVTMDEAVLSAN